MKNAILAVEDARFYDHIGIDPIRIIGAAWKNLTTDKVEGGSTLTQQLAKNLFLSKEQTLQAQSERVGAGAPDRTLLHQEPDHGVVRQPHLSGRERLRHRGRCRNLFRQTGKGSDNRRSSLARRNSQSAERIFTHANPAKAKERRDLVLDLMAKNGFATQAEVDAAKAKPIQLADTAYYQSQPKSSAVRLSGRTHPTGSRRQIHNSRGPGRSFRLHDDQCRSAEESL